jgi:predicted  nucleic acid-binding Zn-ribbon protein
MLYQLQVLADQLTSTHKKRTELQELREQNTHDYHALNDLLIRQTQGLNDASGIKVTIMRDMYRLSEQIQKIRRRQAEIQSRIDYRSEVELDKQVTNNQNNLYVKFRELNQLLWQLGEPLRHPTVLKAHLNGALDIIELIGIERELQLSFSGFDSQGTKREEDESEISYLQRLCTQAAGLIKKIGGVGRYNTFLNLPDAECKSLTEGWYEELIDEDQKLLESRGISSDVKRVSRARVQRVQYCFDATTRSFTKRIPAQDPRPKTYDAILRACGEKEYHEMKEALEPHLPLCAESFDAEEFDQIHNQPEVVSTSTESRSADVPKEMMSAPELSGLVVSNHFKRDYTINSRGFLHVFRNKYDRLGELRARMDRVEELQSRELSHEESKVSQKLSLQDRLRGLLSPRHLNLFNQAAKARNQEAVAYVQRNIDTKQEGFCSGCKVIVPKSLHQQVRRLKELKRCHSCHRILVPFSHVIYIKEEVDPLLVSEEERLEMEERGELGLIPACSNCESELYADKDLKVELEAKEDLTVHCPHCYSYLVPLPDLVQKKAAEADQGIDSEDSTSDQAD